MAAALATPAGAGRQQIQRPSRCLVATLVAFALALLPLEPWGRDSSRLKAAAQRHGPLAVQGVQALELVLVAAQSQPERERLETINRFFNERIAFAEDLDMAGAADHWASPIELLARGAGDCEDYAIAKYFSLVAAGVSSERLRLVYVRADVRGRIVPHMVLAWYERLAAEPLILDNLEASIRPAAERRDLRPVFSFNAEALWNGTAGTTAGDSPARLSRWREVVAKARAEGFGRADESKTR